MVDVPAYDAEDRDHHVVYIQVPVDNHITSLTSALIFMVHL